MKFAIEVKPFKDESLNSWIIRNAIANGSDPSSFYLALWHKFRAWNKDIDKYLPTKYIQILTKLTSLGNQEIEYLTLKPYMQDIMGSKKLNCFSRWYFLISMGRRGANMVGGMHFCPKCLKQPFPYLKRQWRLAWNIGCPIHKVKLILKCQKCNAVFFPQLLKYDSPKIYLCTTCGFDLRESKTEDVNPVSIEFQEKLNSAIFYEHIDSSLALITRTNQDLFITIRILISFLQYIYKFKKYNTIFKSIGVDKKILLNAKINNIFEKMDVSTRDIILETVFKLLSLNIDKIKYLLEEANVTCSILSGRFKIISPTIAYLMSDLKCSKNREAIHISKNNIKPKERSEVNYLYDSLLKYI